MSTNKIDVIYSESEKAHASEKNRYDKLSNKAEQYIASIAIIIGFNLIDLDRIVIGNSIDTKPINLFSIIAFLLLGIGLVLSLFALRIMNYSSYPRGEVLIDELKGEEINGDIAKIKIAKMYLSAFNENAKINDRRANLLSWVTLFIVSGFVFAVVSQIVSNVY